MLRKLDNKTRVILLGILTITVAICVIFLIENDSWAPIAVSCGIGIVLALIVVQVNLDKRFTVSHLKRLAKQLAAQASDSEDGKRKMEESLSRGFARHSEDQQEYLNKIWKLQEENLKLLSGIRNRQTEIEKGLTHIQKYLDHMPIKQSVRHFDVNNSIENLKTALSTSNATALHGRAAAAVNRDPERMSKIGDRVTGSQSRLFLSISSSSLQDYVESTVPGATISVIAQSNVIKEFDRLRNECDYSLPPIFLLEVKFIETSLWSTALSSSGTEKFRVIKTIADEIRNIGGFTIVVGEFEVKNTYSESIEGLADILINMNEFGEDWSYDAPLSVPRALQRYLIGEKG